MKISVRATEAAESIPISRAGAPLGCGRSLGKTAPQKSAAKCRRRNDFLPGAEWLRVNRCGTIPQEQMQEE